LIARLARSLRGLWRADPPLSDEHVALDLETTGLDPQRDSILSAGWVPIRDGVIRWGERRYHLVQPEGPSSADDWDAVKIHGLLPDELSSALPLPQLVSELAELLGERVLVVHWRRLDLGILRRVFRQQGTPWPEPRVVDTIDLLRRVDHRRSLTEPFARATPTQLAEARRQLGLPPHAEHHALYDALATAELYLVLRSRLRRSLTW
jgi:DNA polymerase-3 subunit epsilon